MMVMATDRTIRMSSSGAVYSERTERADRPPAAMNSLRRLENPRKSDTKNVVRVIQDVTVTPRAAAPANTRSMNPAAMAMTSISTIRFSRRE